MVCRTEEIIKHFLDGELLCFLERFPTEPSDHVFPAGWNLRRAFVHQDFPGFGTLLENLVAVLEHLLVFVLPWQILDSDPLNHVSFVFVALLVARNPVARGPLLRFLSAEAAVHSCHTSLQFEQLARAHVLLCADP